MERVVARIEEDMGRVEKLVENLALAVRQLEKCGNVQPISPNTQRNTGIIDAYQHL